MKKLILLTAIFATLSSQSFAKTEGSYFGIDVIRNSMNVNSSSNSPHSSDAAWYNHKKSDDAFGVGLNYKYAFNFNNFFIAPAVSFNFANNKTSSRYDDPQSFTSLGVTYKVNNPYSHQAQIKSQLNLQANFGYDVTDNFAFYVPLGVSSISYQIDTDDRALFNGVTTDYITTKQTGRKTAGFIGVGLSYQIAKNLVVNLEYNKFQEIDFKANKAAHQQYDIKTKINLDSVKLGVSYGF